MENSDADAGLILYRGKPLQDYTKEELILIIRDTSRTMRDAVESKEEWAELLRATAR